MNKQVDSPSVQGVEIRALHAGRSKNMAAVWLRFLGRRAAGFAGTLLALVVITFGIIQLIPGDPARAIAGEDATLEQVEAFRVQLGLDRPLLEQFFSYLANLLQGDLGTSFMYNLPVSSIVANRFPFTATISIIGIILVIAVAVPVGILVAALTRGGKRNMLGRSFGVITGAVDSVPGYVMASLLLALFGIGIGLIELFPPAYSSRNVWPSLVMPIAALAIGPICSIARVVRRETEVVLGNDYIRTARGWRLPSLRIYIKHVLPNLMTSTLTLSGLILSGMLGGALVIETVFALPGLGTGVIKAILDRDFPVVQGMVLVIGLIAALVNLAVDITLGILDPRTLGDVNEK